jgi:transposase
VATGDVGCHGGEASHVHGGVFREGAVRIVTETGKQVPEVAKWLGINETTPASWASRAKRAEKAAPEKKDALIARLSEESGVAEGEQGARSGT